MKRVRFWCVAFFAWCFVLCNTERMFAPINLASFVYVASAAAALLLLTSPRLQRLSLTWLVLAPLPLIVAVKAWLGYHVGGWHLPITVTELCAFAVTVILARQLGAGLEEFRRAVVNMMAGYLHDRSMPFKSGQGEIYREIRRARIYHRPLSLLAVEPAEESVKLALDDFLRQVERETVRRYVSGRIADFLSAEMKDCDIITQRDGHFVLLLPEAGHEQAARVVANLVRVARDELGLELKVGVSVFPEQGSTFVSLLENAEAALRNGAAHHAGAIGKPAEANGHPENGHAGVSAHAASPTR